MDIFILSVIIFLLLTSYLPEEKRNKTCKHSWKQAGEGDNTYMLCIRCGMLPESGIIEERLIEKD